MASFSRLFSERTSVSEDVSLSNGRLRIISTININTWCVVSCHPGLLKRARLFSLLTWTTRACIEPDDACSVMILIPSLMCALCSLGFKKRNFGAQTPPQPPIDESKWVDDVSHISSIHTYVHRAPPHVQGLFCGHRGLLSPSFLFLAERIQFLCTAFMC